MSDKQNTIYELQIKVEEKKIEIQLLERKLEAILALNVRLAELLEKYILGTKQ